MDFYVSGSIPKESLYLTNVVEAAPLQLTEGSLIEATVQRVVDSMVLLNINGRLLSARTEIPLQTRQPVLLEVSQTDTAQITLRLLNHSTLSGNEGEANSFYNFQALLTSWGLDADDINLTIARALLTHSHTINPEDIQTVRSLWPTISQAPSLAGISPATKLEALVYLQANQLPINEESLALASHWLDAPLPSGTTLRIAQGLENLQAVMGQAVAQLRAGAGENPELRRLLTTLESVFTQIADWSISADTPTKEIVARLASLIPNLNTPPEAEFSQILAGAKQSSSPSAPTQQNLLANNTTENADKGQQPPNTPPVLAETDAAVETAQAAGRLKSQVFTGARANTADLANPIHRLAAAITEALAKAPLDGSTPEGARVVQVLQRLADQLEAISKDLGAIQLNNITHTVNQAAEQYYLFPIPLTTPNGPTTAQLKIYQRPGRRSVDPENVRLALLLDLPELGEIAINLTVLQKRLSGQIFSRREQTHQRVETELGKLSSSFSSLGYWVDSLTCDLLSASEEQAVTVGQGANETGMPLARINVRA